MPGPSILADGPDTRAPLDAPFPLAARVRYLGFTRWDGDGRTVRLAAGMIGQVVRLVPGRQGTGRLLDENESGPTYHESAPAASLVRFETGVECRVTADNENYAAVDTLPTLEDFRYWRALGLADFGAEPDALRPARRRTRCAVCRRPIEAGQGARFTGHAYAGQVKGQQEYACAVCERLTRPAPPGQPDACAEETPLGTCGRDVP